MMIPKGLLTLLLIPEEPVPLELLYWLSLLIVLFDLPELPVFPDVTLEFFYFRLNCSNPDLIECLPEDVFASPCVN